MTDAVETRRPPSRVPALVQAGVVGMVLALIAAVSLTARQPPPPSVAEYAPQAVAQIKQAPPEQSQDLGRGGGATTSTAGSGSGTAGLNGAGGTTAPTRPVIEKPRVRRCVGDPPRQIEDPQSPPCVPYFDPKQSNGGATYRGVTADAINVYYTPDFLEDKGDVVHLASFFNKRFETYGRSIVLLEHPAGGGVDPDPKLMQADAQTAADDPDFASLNYVSRGGAEFFFYDALADKGIVSVAHRVQAQATEAHLRKRSPYQWSVVPTVDSMMRNYGQFACSALAGKPPRYAGGVEARAAVRKFGLIIQRASDGTAPDPGPLRAELAKCNVEPVLTYEDVNSSATRTGQAAIVRMTDADVTSVICLCDALEVREKLMPAASAQAFQPEWLLGSYLDNDLDNSMNQAPPDQAGHVLGLLFRNKLLPKQDMPWYWALKEINPSSDPQGNNYYALQARYSSLLVLASGIQMAGPHLTPQTFAAGLLRTQWANPGAGAAPLWQARAGFDGGRRTFIDDAAMYWFDPNRRSTVAPDQTGAVCYVRRGERRGLGAWGDVGDPPFFQQPCL